MKQIMLVVILAAATSTFARLGDTQKEFEQANPDFKYTGESPGNEANTMVRQYAGDSTVAQIVFGADGKVIMEAYSDLSGKFPESSLGPVAKSYGYDFSALEKISISGPWKDLVLHRDFWFSADHKFCVGIGDVVMNDSKTASTMTVAGEQVAPTLYQNSTKKRSDEPATMPTTMSEHDQMQLAITATVTLIKLGGFYKPSVDLKTFASADANYLVTNARVRAAGRCLLVYRGVSLPCDLPIVELITPKFLWQCFVGMAFLTPSLSRSARFDALSVLR